MSEAAWGVETTWDGEEVPPTRLSKTHDLRPSDPVRALDARVLAYMNYQDQIISTPNANWVPEYPLITEAGILKRDDGYWGGHEYTRWPQYFSKHVFHHACIPFWKTPIVWNHGGEDLMWYNPRPYDLTEDADTDLRTDEKIGLLDKDLVNKVSTLLETVAAETFSVGSKVAIPETRKVYDRCLSNGRSALDSLRLRKAAFRTIVFTLRDVQRAILELRGLHTYLDVVVKRMNAPNAMWKAQNFLLPVRGAFTTEAAVADNLYWLGIPVWYISAEKAIAPDTKIFDVQECVPWTSQLSKEYVKYKGSLLLFGWNFDIEPRMRDMAASQLMNNHHMSYLLDQMYNFQYYAPAPKPFSYLSATSSSNPSTGLPSLPAPVRPSPAALKRKKGGSTRRISNDPSVNHARILYVPNGIDGTPDLPPFCYTVHEALKDLGTVGDESSPAALYPLPPPFFLTHESNERSADLYLNYIRIRPVLFDILINGGLFDKSVWRKLRDWRNILHGDYKKSTPLPPNTVSPFVERVYSAMPGEGSSAGPSKGNDGADPRLSDLPPAKRQRIAEAAKMKVTFGVERKLAPFDRTQPQTWRGKSVSVASIMADKILRLEVQWELMETLFRYELYALDQAILPRSRMTTDEHSQRNTLLTRVYLGASHSPPSVIPDMSKAQKEYWGDDVLDHGAVQALRDVVRAWPNCPVALKEDTELHTRDFALLIRFYTTTFVRFFNRIPSMHCKPPASLSTLFKTV